MKQEKFTELLAQVKKVNPNKTIQKVVPEKSTLANQKQFSFYIDKNVLKKLKSRALEEDRSLKDIINESILNYLKP